MTHLYKRKTHCVVIFSDCVREHGKLREVIFTLTPHCISVRLKGMRSSFDISPAAVFDRAVKIGVEGEKAEKKAKKGKKK